MEQVKEEEAEVKLEVHEVVAEKMEEEEVMEEEVEKMGKDMEVEVEEEEGEGRGGGGQGGKGHRGVEEEADIIQV